MYIQSLNPYTNTYIYEIVNIQPMSKCQWKLKFIQKITAIIGIADDLQFWPEFYVPLTFLCMCTAHTHKLISSIFFNAIVMCFVYTRCNICLLLMHLTLWHNRKQWNKIQRSIPCRYIKKHTHPSNIVWFWCEEVTCGRVHYITISTYAILFLLFSIYDNFNYYRFNTKYDFDLILMFIVIDPVITYAHTLISWFFHVI